MKVLRAVLVLSSVLLWLAVALNVWGALPACGTERWDVKTLSDFDGQRLDSVLLTDVSNLGRIVRPPGWSIEAPRLGIERQIYQVRASIVYAAIEGDSDVHLALQEIGLPEADGKLATMIAEAADPLCAPRSYHIHEIINTRVALRHQIGGAITKASVHQLVGYLVQVTGVLFFDVQHGQYGAARNNAELHPILDIQFLKKVR